jgi:uncharacterized membrane protein YhaH (DUF805 family)
METGLKYFTLPFKNAFEVAGRSNKPEFQVFTLWVFLINLTILSLPFFAAKITGTDNILLYLQISKIVSFCSWLVFIAPSVTLTIRRLHDINLTAWFIIIAFIPVISLFFFLFLFFYPGTKGDNKYGPQV